MKLAMEEGSEVWGMRSMRRGLRDEGMLVFRYEGSHWELRVTPTNSQEGGHLSYNPKELDSVNNRNEPGSQFSLKASKTSTRPTFWYLCCSILS